LADSALYLLATSALPANALVVGPTVTQTDTRITLQNLILADIGLSPSSYAYRSTHRHHCEHRQGAGGQSSMSIRPERAYADQVDILYLLLWAAVALAGLCIVAPPSRKGWDAYAGDQ
jgi:hypothetical protein